MTSRLATANATIGPAAHRGLDIVVGDGRSDFCIAERAQLVLAKGQLAAHCRAKDLPHWPIE